MIDSSDYSLESDNNQQKTHLFRRRKWYGFWRSLIYLMLVSLGGGISYSWYFLTQEMIPRIEKPVSKLLSRPIKLGEIQAISLASIRLGESYLPTTDTENDYVIIEAVEIGINPFKLIKKQVELKITLNNLKGYLKQDEDNSWLKLRLNTGKTQEGGWRFDVNEIAVQDSNLNIKNNQYQQNKASSLIKVSIPLANISFSDPNQYVFNLQGNLENGGKVQGSGFHKPKAEQWFLKLDNHDVPINTVNQIVNLPVNLDSGKVNGNLAFSLFKSQLDLGSLDGEMKFAGVNLSIPKLPQTLSNSRGKIAFKNNNITLKEVNTNFGLVNAQAQGVIKNYQELDITANTNNSVTIDQVLTSLKLDKVNLEREGKVKGKLNITGDILQPLVKADVVNDGNIKIDQIPINKLSADLAIRNSRLNLEKVQILPTIGGKINATGRVSLDPQDSNFTIDWQGENIEAEKVASLYQQKLPIQVGKVNGKYKLTGNWQRINQTKLTGFSIVELASGQATINQLEIDNTIWGGEVNLSSFKLTDLPTLDCDKIGCQESILDGKFKVSGKRDSFGLDNINLAGRFDFDLAQGKVTLENTQVSGNNWQALVKLDSLDVSQLPSVNLSSLPIKEDIKVTADLQARGNLKNIRDIDVKGTGNINLPQGNIKVNDFTLKKDDFITTIITNSFPLQDLNPTLRGDATGKLTLAGNLNNLQAESINVDGDLKLSEGISIVKQPLDVAFRWNGNNLQVKEAIVDDGIKAQGIINYDLDSNTVTDINLDLTAKQLNIKELPLPKSLAFLNYQGQINFQGKVKGDIASPRLQGEVNVNNLQLANLPFSRLWGSLDASLTEGINLDLNSSNGQDKLSFKLDGDYQPQEIYLQTQNTKIQGTAEQKNLAVNVENIPLNKVTQPWLSYFPESMKKIDGNLSGDIDLDLNSYNLTKANIVINQPRLNYLQADTLTTEFTSANGIFTITKGSIKHLGNQYDFTGELQPFIENPRLQANLKVAKGEIQSLLTSLQFFELGDISDGFKARKYATAKDLYTSVNNSPVDSENGDGNSLSSRQDKLSSSTNPLPADEKQELTNQSSSLSNPQSNSPSNNIQKPLVSIQEQGESLSDILAFFRTIEKQVNENNQQRANSTLPTLEQLNGNFSGSIDLTASMDTGVKAEFDFQGDYWQWGKYEGDLLQLAGSYHDGLLTFLPVKIQSNDSILSLTGTFQPERISGEVTLSNFPVSQLKPFLNIPETFDIEGDINATIAIGGSEEKPLAKGNIEVVDSKINGQEIETTQASFGFRNSRIDFLASSNLSEELDYFTIIASIPFQLFPNSSKPDSNDFNVDFYLRKEGFSLLSVVTDNQLNWVEGDGNVDLTIKGKYNQARNEVTDLQTDGIANLSNGLIQGKVLDEGAITNINGQVLFDFAQINIPNLSGNFSGGQISVSGTLPLIDDTSKGQSLNISVDDLALNLESLYQGNAHGNLAITGTAIAPKIGGKVELDNGNIQIAAKENNQNKQLSQNQTFSKIKFNDLSLKLGDNLHIVQPVLLKLKAEGKLNINGDLNNLSPEGTVNLKSGTVNLFTSQFKLLENRDNIARFTPQNGFNPYLDLQLVSSVTETSRYQLPDHSNPNEIKDILNDFSVNTAQTIKVKANVQGWSDNLINNIELSSSPPRNQTEIIALLGGGFVGNFAGGNSELNLVNLASAAVLGGVQGEIQKASGFDQLRLFPAQIIDSEERTSSFGLGAELALDLTDTLSVSVTKILTNEQAPRYSIRYRLNEQTILRGSSNFQKDTRGIIEFQQRF